MTLAGSCRPPEAELDFPLRIWVRNGGGRWHATRAAARGWSAEDDSDMTMRLEVVPPLSPATAWIEVPAAGQTVQARATLPASLAVAAGGYQPAWPPRRSHRADCYLTAARSFGESYPVRRSRPRTPVSSGEPKGPTSP